MPAAVAPMMRLSMTFAPRPCTRTRACASCDPRRVACAVSSSPRSWLPIPSSDTHMLFGLLACSRAPWPSKRTRAGTCRQLEWTNVPPSSSSVPPSGRELSAACRAAVSSAFPSPMAPRSRALICGRRAQAASSAAASWLRSLTLRSRSRAHSGQAMRATACAAACGKRQRHQRRNRTCNAARGGSVARFRLCLGLQRARSSDPRVPVIFGRQQAIGDGRP